MRIRLIHRYFVLLILLAFTGCAAREPVVSKNDDLSSKIIVQDINPETALEKPAEPEQPVSKPMARVMSHRLNLREKSSAKSRILGVLKKGDVIEILSEKGKWVQVHNETGLSGWVFGRYIESIDGVSITKANDVKKPTKKLKSGQKKEIKLKKNRSPTPAKAAAVQKTEKAIKPTVEKQAKPDQDISGQNISEQNIKVTEKELKSSQDSTSLHTQFVFDTPIKKAVEKMLLDSGDDQILRTTTHIASSVLGDFATSNISYELNREKTKIKVYLFKENGQWIANRKIPSHFDHHGMFLMLAREYCIDKWRYFNGIGYLDNSWKNKDPRTRMINFNCRVVENNEWKDNHLKFTYEYNKPKGWHIIEVFNLNADAQSGKQSGIIDQIKKVPSEGTKKAPTKPEAMVFSNQVVDRFFISILGGDIEAVKGFLDAGMSPNVKRPRLGHSPLFTSVIGHRDEIALLLIKKGADVNFRDENQSAPLMWAAENCNAVPLVKALIGAGAYVNARAKGGGTPLMGAEDNHCEEIVRILKEAGAN